RWLRASINIMRAQLPERNGRSVMGYRPYPQGAEAWLHLDGGGLSARDSREENMTPVGRIAYRASTIICVPTPLAQETGRGLGAQVVESRKSEVIRAGGFTRVHSAAESPLNMVLEAR
ncbi:MAG: hypothetical protein KGY53_13515, partial [Wenzhouxiangellaceae bacterium]|nr:hypothetical protein [Wenzhouxiangellaceae bacterium]